MGYKHTIPEVSVVIAAHNCCHYLDACLAGMQGGSSVDYEVVVADNASTDETLSLLRDRHPNVKVIANAKNEGHCRAINQSIANSRGEYILILDADTVLTTDDIGHLVQFMRRHPEIAITAPRMLNEDGSVQETARSFPSIVNGLFGRQTLLTRLLPNNPFSRSYLRRSNLNDSEPFEVDWVSAACMIFPRLLVQKIGPWDEEFKGYWVDADWCKRAHSVGKVYCLPSVRVRHFEQNRAGKKKGVARILLFHSGAYLLYRKHHTLGIFDPRAIFAGLALAARAGLLVLGDLLRSAKTPDVPQPVSGRPAAPPIKPLGVEFQGDEK